MLEQSGIKAGDGGFQVTVAGNTDLKGGLLSSSQVAVDEGNNILMTGSLTASDLQNKDEFSASGFSMSGSVSGTFGNQTLPPGKTLTKEQQKAANAGGAPTASAGIGSASGSQSSTTFSGISGGLVIITDQKKQDATGKDADAVLATIDQTVTTESAAANASALTKGWDGQQLQKEVDAQVAITKEFSKQAPKAIAEYAQSQIEALQKSGASAEEIAKWGEGGVYRVALHAVSGGLTGGIGGALGSATVAGSAEYLDKLQSMTMATLVEQGLSPGAAKMFAEALAEATAVGIGVAAGGSAGAAAALATDTNNRQLHPTEMKWIKENAKSFAQQLNGGVLPTAQQIIEAEQRLAQQAYRQVQYGVGGEADVSAMAFLKQANGLLAADPNCSTCGPGYMFYATPEQKLNVAMYGTNLQQTNDFYAKNGLSKPTLQQIIDGARSAGQKTDLATQRTFLAGLAAGTIALGPAFSGLASELAAFARNPVGYCLNNPVACIVTAETAGYTAAGVPQPSGVVPISAATVTKLSVDDKLARYLLNMDHSLGVDKAKWFEAALGFNKNNADELAKQIVFNEATAVRTVTIPSGDKYDQFIPITGANGKLIDVKFTWIRNNDGLVRLVTATPSKPAKQK